VRAGGEMFYTLKY